MRIAYLSDLHLEFGEGRPPDIVLPAGTDVFVCAGDVATRGSGPAQLVDIIESGWLASEDGAAFDTIFVPGNHDYYGAPYDDARARMREFRAPRFHMLDEGEIRIDGVDFVGTTLWTDFGRSEALARRCAVTISDFHVIPGFDVARCRAEHDRQRAFLEVALAKPRDGKRVVVTHFCPTLATEHPEHPGSPLTRYFQVDADSLVPRADAWIFGHTHHDVDMTIGHCRVLSAQVGYPAEKAWAVGVLDLAG
jgi:predicted phosphodiesterase